MYVLHSWSVMLEGMFHLKGNFLVVTFYKHTYSMYSITYFNVPTRIVMTKVERDSPMKYIDTVNIKLAEMAVFFNFLKIIIY